MTLQDSEAKVEASKVLVFLQSLLGIILNHKFEAMLSYLIVLSFLVGTTLADKEDSLMWKNYEKVMAKRLSDTFHSTSTLLAAHELAMSQGDVVVQYGCSNYTEGAAIGRISMFVFDIDCLSVYV